PAAELLRHHRHAGVGHPAGPHRPPHPVSVSTMAVVADTRSSDMLADAHASQWTLTWRAFRRHRLALASTVIVLLFYLIGMFAEFLAPFDPNGTASRDVYHPPQAIHFIDTDEAGGWSFRPYVNAMVVKRDPMTLQSIYESDDSRKIYLSWFGEG